MHLTASTPSFCKKNRLHSMVQNYLPMPNLSYLQFLKLQHIKRSLDHFCSHHYNHAQDNKALKLQHQKNSTPKLLPSSLFKESSNRASSRVIEAHTNCPLLNTVIEKSQKPKEKHKEEEIHSPDNKIRVKFRFFLPLSRNTILIITTKMHLVNVHTEYLNKSR